MTTEYLLDREVELVLSALTETNRLVIRTALVTGLRVGDVLALKPDRLKPHFWVTEQKTGKARQVGLPEPLLSGRPMPGRPECSPAGIPGSTTPDRQSGRMSSVRPRLSGCHRMWRPTAFGRCMPLIC